MQPPDDLYLEGEYEQLHIAELHDKVDAAMVSLMEAYKQRDGAKRHKQVMIQMATPKHKPKRRQKQLLKAAEARVEEATREGDALIAKMQENVLNWKGEPVCVLRLLNFYNPPVPYFIRLQPTKRVFVRWSRATLTIGDFAQGLL